MTWHSNSESTSAASFSACVLESTGIAISLPCSSASAKQSVRSSTRAGGTEGFAASRADSASAKSRSCATRSKSRRFCSTVTSGSIAPSLRSSMPRRRACVRNASSFKLARKRRFLTRKATWRSFTRFAADFSWSRGVAMLPPLPGRFRGLASGSASSPPFSPSLPVSSAFADLGSSASPAGMASSSSPKPRRRLSWRSRSLRASTSSAERPRLSSSALRAAPMASSAERLATAALRERLSERRRLPSRTRFAASSPLGRGRGASPPAAPSGEARSTFFSVASVASLIFSRRSAELAPERPASSTMTARSRSPTPATVIPTQSRCSCIDSSTHCATPLTASPSRRSCLAASRSCTVVCRVRSRKARSARCLGIALRSLHSSAPRIILCAQTAIWSAASRAATA
mmetsp:Transcript_42811/g.123799  ORF Transcript_42811/g.123799 Transcript_42811/m.123799 type:complete len:403 (-) Transcript_42811:1049-2257(-)